MKSEEKKQTEKIDYFQVLKFLDDENIKYDLDNHIDYLKDIVEVCPLSEIYEFRKFNVTNGKQVVGRKDPRKRTKLDFFDYKEFIEFLTEINIKYEEHKYVEVSMLDKITIMPFSKKIKGIWVIDENLRPVFLVDYIR